ncbi:hypothetical protein IW150_002214, partial [Coemansia sp. RSA 2607]
MPTIDEIVEVQANETCSVTEHPVAAKLHCEYADRLRHKLPEELPPQCPQDPMLELRPDAKLQNRVIYR